MRRCKACVAGVSEDEHFNVVSSESQAYLRQLSVQQQWSGDEPALQLLFLPDSSAPALPAYDDTPEYLSPSHCRLCLRPVPATELESHVAEAHQIPTMQPYRAQIFRLTLAAWPEAISPQLLRSRLATFEEELSDFNFELLTCVVCARQKRQCKFREVQFPPSSSVHPPAWSPWVASSWQTHRDLWCNQIHELLSTESYLTRFFLVEDREGEVLP